MSFRIGLVFCAVSLTVHLHAQELRPDFSKLAAIEPGPDVVAAAKAYNIPLSGIDRAGDSDALNSGDSFSAVVTLCEKAGKRTQWLLYLCALESAETLAKTNRPLVLYSGRSNRFEFASSPVQVRLQTLGPFGDVKFKSRVQETSVAFHVDKGFLSLGLDRAAATVWRTIQTTEKGSFYFGTKPPNAAQAAQYSKLAEPLQLAPDEERSLAGAIPALISYFEIVQHTQGLEDILLRVIEKPSMWSVVRHLGVTVSLTFDTRHVAPAETSRWGLLSTSAIYDVPFLLKLNGRLAATVTMVVTSPRPPLLSCGGIIGMLVEKPGDKATYLTLRIVSARLSHEIEQNSGN